MQHSSEGKRETHPNRCRKKRERETQRADESLTKSTLRLHHNSCHYLFLYALLVLGIKVDVVVAGGVVGSTSGGGP